MIGTRRKGGLLTLETFAPTLHAVPVAEIDFTSGSLRAALRDGGSSASPATGHVRSCNATGARLSCLVHFSRPVRLRRRFRLRSIWSRSLTGLPPRITHTVTNCWFSMRIAGSDSWRTRGAQEALRLPGDPIWLSGAATIRHRARAYLARTGQTPGVGELTKGHVNCFGWS